MMGPTTGDKQAEAQALADELLGSCDPLPDHVTEDCDLCEHLDALVIRCEVCDWWVEVYDTDDNVTCTVCSREEED